MRDEKDDHEHDGGEHGDENANNGHGGGQDNNGDSITIIVNGRQRAVEKNAVFTYWDIVKLAFDNPQTGDGIQYTVQYTRGPNENHSGALVEGQSVKIKKDMEFDVTPTNRS